jgi:hypothetical protein
MMSVTFVDAPPDPSTRCIVCADFLSEGVVGHDNMHFLHKKCIEAWKKYHNSCPFCRSPSVYDSYGDDEATVFATSLGGVVGAFIAGILINKDLICAANENCLQMPMHDMQTVALQSVAGAIMGIAIGKLICKCWVPKSSIEALARSWPAGVASLIVPAFAVYNAAQY